MFWINKPRAEKAAMIIAGYCDKQLTCDKCRFADENGDYYTIPRTVPARCAFQIFCTVKIYPMLP